VRVPEFWRRANFTDRLLLIYFAALTVVIIVRRDHVAGWPMFIALHATLVGLIAALIWWQRRWGHPTTQSPRRWDPAPHAHAWYPLVIPLIAFPETALLHDVLVADWRDRYLLAFEAALFPQPPTVWLGSFSSIAFSEIVQLGYLSYFLFLPIVAVIVYRRQDKKPFYTLMATTMLGYVVCYVTFLVFPTEGPAHTLRHLHTQPLPAGPLYATVLFIQKAGTHGNAFPSAHVVGAVVPVIFAWRYVPKLAPWLLPLLVLMCIGAVHDRYHYASDMLGGLVIGGIAAWFMWPRDVSKA
jgi:membrane-associated phospholipid phosphatase